MLDKGCDATRIFILLESQLSDTSGLKKLMRCREGDVKLVSYLQPTVFPLELSSLIVLGYVVLPLFIVRKLSKGIVSSQFLRTYLDVSH